MDTSETYIKMCEKATEIQTVWKPNDGDWYYSPKQSIPVESDCDYFIHLDEGVRIYPGPRGYGNGNYYHGKIAEDKSWLPRQDQLQEMLPPRRPFALLDDLNYFCFPMDRLGGMPYKSAIEKAQREEDYIASFATMEQLWLAYVMQEKYGKKWNGQDWVDNS